MFCFQIKVGRVIYFKWSPFSNPVHQRVFLTDLTSGRVVRLKFSVMEVLLGHLHMYYDLGQILHALSPYYNMPVDYLLTVIMKMHDLLKNNNVW